MNTALIRQVNLAKVFHALREHPNSSQRELVAATGLDKATVSAVVAQLEADGLIVRSTRRGRGRVGRPEVALRLAPEAGVLVGVRLEPATIRLIATRIDGAPIATHQVAGSMDLARSIAQLERGFAELLAHVGVDRSQVRGVGVGIPALIDLAGHLVLAPNLGWRDTEVIGPLEAALGLAVTVDNDTNAAALAEKLFGSCREVRDFLFIAGHSGIGAALYLDDRLYRGVGGFAGEFGHMTVLPGGRRCGCGKRGCLETYLSEGGILGQLAERDRAFEDLMAVREAAADPEVAAVLLQAARLLGLALANVLNLLNPQRVVLGGNLAVIAPLLLPELDRQLAVHALAAVRQRCQLVISPLGIESVPMGGVALALNGFMALPGQLAPLRGAR